jgi:hypothetical protein
MPERCWPLISRLLALGVAVVVLVTAQNASSQGRLPAQTAPQSGYWLCLETYLDGDFREALAGFRDVARTRIITTAQTPWIDSIC